MKLKFECTNRRCPNTKEHQHQLDLPTEMVMDEKNMAVMYCPKCKQQLKKTK